MLQNTSKSAARCEKCRRKKSLAARESERQASIGVYRLRD